MVVRFKKLTENAVIPTRAHKTDAGFDLTATSVRKDEHDIICVGTGIAVEIPEGHVGLVFPRSSIFKTGLQLSNSVGVIDSGYRGEIMAKFYIAPFTDAYVPYKVGDRIGQLIIMPIPDVEFVEAEELTDSDRGTGGYGSTGK